MAETQLEQPQIPSTVPCGYTVTLGDATNELTEQAILSATIPANDWGDNEKIYIEYLLSGKKDAGYAGAGVPIKLKWGATSTTLEAALVPDTTTKTQYCGLLLWRVGTGIYVFNMDVGAVGNIPAGVSASVLTADILSGGGNALLTSQSFNAETTLQMTAQWDEAHANNTVGIIAGRVVRT